MALQFTKEPAVLDTQEPEADKEPLVDVVKSSKDLIDVPKRNTKNLIQNEVEKVAKGEVGGASQESVRNGLGGNISMPRIPRERGKAKPPIPMKLRA